MFYPISLQFLTPGGWLKVKFLNGDFKKLLMTITIEAIDSDRDFFFCVEVL